MKHDPIGKLSIFGSPCRRQRRMQSMRYDVLNASLQKVQSLASSKQRRKAIGSYKRLDWHLYTTLKNSIAKRLYRFLDKRFYHSSSFEMDLRELAVNRVGLSATQNVAQLKRALLKGLAELETRWDVKSIPNDKRFHRRARGDWTIRFERKRRSKPAIAQLPSETCIALPSTIDPSQLAYALTKRGIGPASAEELTQCFPAQSIHSMIELFDWYNTRGQSRGPARGARPPLLAGGSGPRCSR